ncbi:HAMP domain-containing histidine kinase [Desulfolucanica intricata]|uniref:HAMP domain-containing histidine kinase n=1 Tax=Desulfolucanica intricata TaxID=1285191 RepID=UPI0008307D6F|nr:HAMP domain-containing histidine kinase [Desulfolucanica intricata]
MVQIGIRWKLAVIFLTVILVTLFSTNWLILNSLETYYLKGRETNYLTYANIIAGTGRDYLIHGERHLQFLARDYGKQVGARVLFLDDRGKVLIDSFSEGWLVGQVLKHEEVTAALKGKSGTGLHFLSTGERVLYVSVPVVKRKQIIGAVLLSGGIDDLFEALEEIQQKILFLSLISALVAGFLSFFLANALTRPIKELNTVVQKVARGYLHQRVKERGRDELGMLARSFNTMSAQLEKLDRARRDFIANASHELKSPLGSIKALAESLIYSNEKDPAVYKEFLGDINSEIDRLNQLVQELLQLVELEEEGGELRIQNQSVLGIIEHVLKLAKPLALEKNIHLSGDAPKELSWPLNHDLAVRMLLNLVDNSIKYTPPGGRVQIEIFEQDGKLVIIVRDSGEGIPPEDLPHIFDRFYRVDKARARETGGSGLGLAIVQKAVKLHGGIITVDSRLDVGTVFEIKIPRQNAM